MLVDGQGVGASGLVTGGEHRAVPLERDVGERRRTEVGGGGEIVRSDHDEVVAVEGDHRRGHGGTGHEASRPVHGRVQGEDETVFFDL